jgi:hypothetical protein
MSAPYKTQDPVFVLLNLIKRNYKNLTDARKTFEVISTRMSLLDNPQELIKFLCEHLKPKELEKKQYGEVFTPPTLIEQKFDKLTIADPFIWSDPSKKFLDPANGIGNYPALAFHRLMNGLKDAIPDENERKKHILENMLYMCELNKKNIEVSRKIFDPENSYSLNLYQGSYLDLDTKKEWGVEKFDVVFGNPPYQPASSNGKANGGKSLWPIFVKKSISLLKIDGFLVFVHPSLWRKPGNELHDMMFTKQFHYLSIHTSQDGDKVFHASTRYDWYILQNSVASVPTIIRYDDDTVSSLTITQELPFIVNHGNDILLKMKEKLSNGFLNAIRTHEGDARRDFVSHVKKNDFIFPSVKSSTKTKGIVLCWCSKALAHQYIQKVIFSDGGDIQPFYDSGKFGTAEHGIYIQVFSEDEGKKIQRFLKSKLVSYIVAATKWSNFQTFPEIFHSMPNPKDLPNNFTDLQVYTYFGLTSKEIDRIEKNLGRSGLTNYVALEAPNVVVPTSTPTSTPTPTPTPTKEPVNVAKPATIDYKKMKVVELKQLCKDRKIKGITGKRKDELIDMLTA